MRRRPEQEREEADGRAQAEARRDALLAELKAREAAGRAPKRAARKRKPTTPAAVADVSAEPVEPGGEEPPTAADQLEGGG